MVFLYKFREKEIQIQSPGEPREQYLGEVRQGTSKLKFNMYPYFFVFQPKFLDFKL